MSITSLQIPASKDWQAFEQLSCDLWAHVCDDAYAQQNGVEVFVRRRKDQITEGARCKGMLFQLKTSMLSLTTHLKFGTLSSLAHIHV